MTILHEPSAVRRNPLSKPCGEATFQRNQALTAAAYPIDQVKFRAFLFHVSLLSLNAFREIKSAENFLYCKSNCTPPTYRKNCYSPYFASRRSQNTTNPLKFRIAFCAQKGVKSPESMLLGKFRIRMHISCNL